MKYFSNSSVFLSQQTIQAESEAIKGHRFNEVKYVSNNHMKIAAVLFSNILLENVKRNFANFF